MAAVFTSIHANTEMNILSKCVIGQAKNLKLKKKKFTNPFFDDERETMPTLPSPFILREDRHLRKKASLKLLTLHCRNKIKERVENIMQTS